MQKIAKVVIPIITCLILWGWLMTSIRCNRLEGFAYISFVTNLERIHLAIVTYANEHSGKMPDSQNWADILMDNQKLIMKGDFVSSVSHPSFGVVYNRNLSGRQYSELKSNCVVLFEGKGQWNATGGKNTFYGYAFRRKQSYLVTLNGDIYYFSSGVMMRLKDDVHIDPNNLIWE